MIIINPKMGTSNLGQIQTASNGTGKKEHPKNYHASTKPEMGKEKLTSKRRAMAGDNSMEASQGF
jgi:hypothetical protein